jgi:tetratricopeptide (TPR) repeat protein
MKQYKFEDFRESGAWCVARMDTQVKDKPVDIYLLMDLPSGLVLAHEAVDDPNGATSVHVKSLFSQARVQRSSPKRLLIAKGEPAIRHFEKEATLYGMATEEVPGPYLEPLLAPLKESFGQHFYSTSSLPYAGLEDWADEDDKESARHFVPDSYDPCPCASGKKFKFCCKPGFGEIMAAMAAAQRGFQNAAIQHISRAKQILGETAEVLARESVVQTYVDPKKAMETLDRALKVNSLHPRANYMRGIDCKLRGDLDGAIAAYQIAISNYPKTDRYHLNEAYNNLGTAFFEKGETVLAKSAWEQALVLLPSDKMVRQNLLEFIYENPDLPTAQREISPFIQRIWSRK